MQHKCCSRVETKQPFARGSTVDHGCFVQLRLDYRRQGSGIVFDLFLNEPSSSYELCNVGGQVFRLTPGDPDPSKNLDTQMKSITQYLKDHDLQTRHLVTNTLFKVADDGTVKTKSTVLVTLQASNLEAPVLDYSADVRATLAKDILGNWKFQSLTVHADNAAIVIKKR